MSRDSVLGIPFNKFFSICGNYDSVIYGRALRAIREIILQRGYDRIMFVRLDDGEVDGVFRTDGYVDARRHSPAEIAHFIEQRVALAASDRPASA
jgi:hypothetical protein